MRLLRSHSGALGPLAPDDEVRAMLRVRLNQLLAGGTAIDAAALEALAQALSGGHIPTVHELGALAPVTSAPSPNWVCPSPASCPGAGRDRPDPAPAPLTLTR